MSDVLARIGEIIDGKYRIVRLLGTGGMGAVYEGENLRIRRRVAIKMLHASASVQPDVIARFEREAQAAAMVGSPHICEVLDVGELPNGARYMVMEYLEGETLSALIKRNGRLRPDQATPILLQLLDALAAAHGAGIIHRDLKPDNVFLVGQRGPIANFVKVLDFGVSKFTQGESMEMTRSGSIVGTPYYMPPEQARASAGIDHRADIYSTGVLLYQASTGNLPFQAETFSELLLKIVLDAPPPPETFVRDLPPAFSAIIMKAIARDPNDRFASCAAFADAIRPFQAWGAPTWAPNTSGVQQWIPPDASSQSSTFGSAIAIDDANAVTGVKSGLGFASASMNPGASTNPGSISANATSVSTPGLSRSGLDQDPNVRGNLLASSTTPAVAMSASSWGNASTASAISGRDARPKAGARTIAGVIGGAVMAGGVLALWMAGSMSKPAATTTAAETLPTVATSAPTAATTATIATGAPQIVPAPTATAVATAAAAAAISAPTTTPSDAADAPDAPNVPSSSASDASAPIAGDNTDKTAQSQRAATGALAPAGGSARAPTGHAAPTTPGAKAKSGPLERAAKPATTDLGY